MQTKSKPGARFFFSLHWLFIIILMFIISSCTVSCHNVKQHRHSHRRRYSEDEDFSGSLIVAQQTTKPEIDSTVSSQINVPVDEPAYLHCKISHRGEFDVTWIRHRDRQLLTVGEDRFTDDHRFQISYRKQSETVEDMTLWLRYTRKNDSGIYECQVSTDPPLRFLVTLNVLEVKKLAKKSDLPPNHSNDRQTEDVVVAPGNISVKSSTSCSTVVTIAVFVCLYANLLNKI